MFRLCSHRGAMDDESIPIPKTTRRARGAVTNTTGRFEPHDRSLFDDGWDIEEETRPLRTEFLTDKSRTILARNASPDVGFDRSINPYRGCEHGCIYCFARPTHAYLGYSPGLDFETKILVKPDAGAILRKTLSRPSYEPAVVAMGTNTDPYQPAEQRHRVMRDVLEVLSDFRHPLSIVTKGALIRRDLDILGEMGRAGLARVGISLTTLDPDLSRRMEPRAAAPKTRLAAIRALKDAGCPAHAMIAPVIPGLTDHELEPLLHAAAGAGAVTASYIVLRMPREISDLFREWLTENVPDRAKRVIARIREVHGGKDYDPAWGRRMRGTGTLANLLKRRFDVTTGKLGLDRRLPPLRTDLFRVPGRATQLALF